MAFDKFLIAPIDDGIRRDVKPWLIPDRAFEVINNAYVFRGRLEKRLGARSVTFIDPEITTRLRMNMAAWTTDGSGDLAGTVPLGAAPPTGTSIGAIGQMFSVGNDPTTLVPATFTVVDDTPGAQDMLSTSTTATVYTFNITTGAFVINGALPNTDVYWYPALPVMGFTQYERSEVNDEHTYAFDTRFSYRLLATGWTRIGASTIVGAPPNPDIWTQSDTDFFWSENYRGLDDYIYLLFTTNHSAADGIRYYDGANWNLFTGLSAQYAANATDLINGCRLIVSFQNRLLFLNTIEYDTAGGTNHTYTGRCRYSAVGSPFYAAAIGSVPEYWPWREDIDGSGSFIDAPTREAIVSCAKIKNRLIVFFERSTYELVYTRNQVYPFVWQEIDSTLGCESTFSVIPFDKVVLGIGENGIHACTGANVERMDNKIPDEVFRFHNHDDSVTRIQGIRDYFNEMVYWAVPSGGQRKKYPNRVLVYNYINGSWAFWDDNITAFGYHQQEGSLTWTEMTNTWENANNQWDDGSVLDKFKFVIAGNQEGYTFLIDRGATKNSTSLQITDIQLNLAGIPVFRVVDHNLSPGDWIRIEDGLSIDLGPPVVVTTLEVNNKHYKIDEVTDDAFTIERPPALTLPYSGNGTIVLLSKAEIFSKRFNFYSNKGLATNIEKTDFYVDREKGAIPADSGELTIDYLSGASWLSLRREGINTGAILGTSILEMKPYTDFEDTQQRFWHAVYLQAQGESIQLKIYWSDDQMTSQFIPRRNFVINGILFHASPTQEL